MQLVDKSQLRLRLEQVKFI